MQTLSRREEADILERGKKDALKACDAVVQGENGRSGLATAGCSILVDLDEPAAALQWPCPLSNTFTPCRIC